MTLLIAQIQSFRISRSPQISLDKLIKRQTMRTSLEALNRVFQKRLLE